jgi:hypothetical protein
VRVLSFWIMLPWKAVDGRISPTGLHLLMATSLFFGLILL